MSETSVIDAPAAVAVPTSPTALNVKPIRYGIADDRIAQLSAMYMPLIIKDVNDAAGLKVVHDARITVKTHRIDIEKTRVESKAEALRYGRMVDSEAKRLIALLEPIEEHLEAEEKRIADEKEKVRQAKEEAKRRVTQARLNEFAKYGATPNPLDVADMSDEQFQADLEKARQVHAEKVKAEEEAAAERARLEEIERQRVEAEKAEEARLKAEEEARLKAEADRLAAERAELERQKAEAEAAAKVQREELERQRREQQAEADRLAAERQRLADEQAAKEREAELAKAKAEAAEKARVEAEERAQREAEQTRAKAAAEEAERKRLESLRPDRDKLRALADSLAAIERPELSPAAATASLQAYAAIQRAVAEIRGLANVLSGGAL